MKNDLGLKLCINGSAGPSWLSEDFGRFMPDHKQFLKN